MRIQDSVWQGSFGYWQNLFIHQHILMIGYTAWNGFLTVGRGMVICDVDLPIAMPVNWTVDTVPHQLQFMAQSQIVDTLQQLELEPDTIFNVLQIVAKCDPAKEIIILITGSGQIDINFLQDLAIMPADCYEQIHHRWDEFQLGMTTQRSK